MVQAIGPLVDRLQDQTDVALSAQTDGQVLTYNATSGKWENADPTGGGGGGGGTSDPATDSALGIVLIDGTPTDAANPVVPVLQADGKIPFTAYEEYHWHWADATARLAQTVSADEVGLQGIQGWPVQDSLRVYILVSVTGGTHWGEIDDRLIGALQASSNLGDVFDTDASLTNLGLHGTPNKVAATDPTGSTNSPVAVRALVAADLPDLSSVYDAAGAAATVQSNLDSEAATRGSADSTLNSFIGGVDDDLNTHAALTTTAHGGIVADTDSRLTDARTPTAHHTTHVTGGSDVIADAVAGGASGLLSGADKTKLNGLGTSSTHATGDFLQSANNLSDVTAATARGNLGLGTAATHDVPASGNATATQVSLGNDTRLSDSRTPTAHATSHISTGGDAIPIAVAAGASGLLSGADKTKLDNTSGTNTGDQTVPAFATPSVALGTTAAAGAAATVIRSDATIVAFDITAPSTQAYGDAAAVGTAVVSARRDHKHAMPAVASDATLTATDVTTNNVTSTKHGFTPKSPADATQFLNGATTPAYAAVKDSDLATTDVTTNNVSTTKHGFAPKAPNDATKYLDGTGAYSVPAGGGSTDVLMVQVFS